ncbi:cyclophilin-like fold protein [Companilactobacillus baiquanensis]|uniref:Cyclophilin-like fold protein n=1 Tax=Companilactobacillus baiquanensis TaxID=2486005 RepID=A0ABW1UWU4_9LACO|nr:cyclophilin-like fold protein [Companilactobacillus baiquanensis]
MKKIWSLFLLLSLFFILGGCIQNNKRNSAPSVKISQKKINRQDSQKIIITIKNKKLTAHLNNSSAAKTFSKGLPKTLSFRDYPGLPEKIADLGYKLPTDGMPKGHAGTRGSIGYWSPQRRIVFYWGTEDYYEGIHIIGHFDTNEYRSIIKNMGNNVNVRITRAE